MAHEGRTLQVTLKGEQVSCVKLGPVVDPRKTTGVPVSDGIPPA